jgi:hypothetical protein
MSTPDTAITSVLSLNAVVGTRVGWLKKLVLIIIIRSSIAELIRGAN